MKLATISIAALLCASPALADTNVFVSPETQQAAPEVETVPVPTPPVIERVPVPVPVPVPMPRRAFGYGTRHNPIIDVDPDGRYSLNPAYHRGMYCVRGAWHLGWLQPWQRSPWIGATCGVAAFE